MKVVLDSSIICADFWLMSLTWRVLLENAERLGYRFYVPRIVLEETTAKFESELRDLERNYVKLNPMGKRTAEGRKPGWTVEERSATYRRWLGDLFANIGGVLDYPDTPHSVLAGRAVRNERPFRQEDRGYRDSLIWETIVALTQTESSSVVFLSKNTRDFGAGGSLHKDLLNDLDMRGVPPDRVRLYHSADDFEEAHVRSTLTELSKLRDEIQLRFGEGCELWRWLVEKTWDPAAMGFRSGFDDLRIAHGSGLGPVKVREVRQLSVSRVLVVATALWHGEVIVQLVRSNLHVLRDYKHGTVFDQGEDKPFLLAVLFVSLEASLTFDYDLQSRSVIAAEIHDLRLTT
jgi:hypothetical protein